MSIAIRKGAFFILQIVQSSTPPAVPVQVRSKHDGSGVAASVSGVRRRSGPQGGLRSPAAKRPVSAPVALQGWLHKQGSEGLMLWKKRWFVLSEYCLFYYKGEFARCTIDIFFWRTSALFFLLFLPRA